MAKQHPTHASPRPLPRGPHDLTREQVRESQRERLFMGMIESVAENGYAATSVADIVARSGVSRATFYELFNDKDTCFRATYERAAAQLAAALRATVRSNAQADKAGSAATSLAQIDRLLMAYLTTLATQPAFARAFLVEVYAAGPEAIRQRQASLEAFIDVVVDIVAETTLAGGKISNRFVVQTIVHAVSSMVTHAVGVGDTGGLPGLHEPIMKIVADLLGPRPPGV